MKLISISEYIKHLEKQIPLELNDSPMADCDEMFVKRVISYQRFLEQPLTLGMFAPCDEDGKVLEELEIFGYIENTGGMNCYATEEDHEKHEQYQKAQERVLFEGFNHIEGGVYSEYEIIKIKDIECKKIEDLIKEDCYLTLNPNAIKQI